MLTYTLRRLAQFVVVLFLGSIAIFAIIYAVPGSPAEAIAGSNAMPEEIEAARERLGLDQPVYVQYLTWLERTVRLDLGQSAVSGVSVSQQLVARLPATLQLTVLTMALSIIVALPIALICALWPRSAAAAILRAYQAITLAIPTFWVGILLVLAFSISLKLLPSVSRYVSVWSDPVGALRNTLLPALSMVFYFSSILSRFIASSVEDAMKQDFVRTARAKGVPERRVVFGHVLRNALLPAVTVVGLQLGSLIGGAIVVETVFSYPGIGRLLYTAINSRDYPLIQSLVLFAMLGFMIINLIVDLAYAWIDPRVKYN